MEQVRALAHRHRVWIGWIAAVAVCLLAILWVRYDLAEQVNNLSVYEIVNDDYTRTVAIPGQDGLTQTIPGRAGQTIYGVRLNVTIYNHAFATGTLHTDLYDETGQLLASGGVSCREALDNSFLTSIFQQPYTPQKNQTLTLHLWTDGFTGQDAGMPFGLWASEGQVGQMALSDAGGSLNATVAIQYVVDYSGSWSQTMLVVPAVLILAAVALGFWLFFRRNPRPVAAVLAAGLLLGGAFCWVTPPLVAPDEYTHLGVAYEYASELLAQPVTDEQGRILVRSCDAPYFLDHTGDIGIFAYKQMGQALTQPGAGISDTPTDFTVDREGRLPLLYLGQTFGVLVARAAGLGFFAMLLLARLCNLAVFLLLAGLAVSLAQPGQKWLFAAVALLPMSLQLAGSLSADAMVLGLVFSYTSLCFALRERQAARWQILLLLVLAACTGPAKAIYLPVILLCLLIPAEHLDWRGGPYLEPLRFGPVQVRAGNLVKLLALVLAVGFWMRSNLETLLYSARDVDKTGLIRAAVALATVIVLLAAVYWRIRTRPRAKRVFLVVVLVLAVAGCCGGLYLLTHMKGGLTPEQLVAGMQPNGDSIYTFSFGYICRNLGQTIKLLLRSLPAQGTLWLEGVLGLALGEPIVYLVEVSWLLGIGLMAALAAAAIPADSTPRVQPLSRRSRVGTTLLVLCVVGLTFVAALGWTPINYTTIFGVQGRYWLPIVPLVLLLVHHNRRWFTHRPAGRGAVYAVVCLTSFVLLQGYSLYATGQVTT